MAFVRDTDRGYKKLLRNVFKPSPGITVGVHGDEGGAPTESGATVADVATVHEFGVGNHPSRSFIRAWFDANKSDNRAVLRTMALTVVKRTNTIDSAAKKAALFLENSCKGYIQSDSVSPKTEKRPNAKSTTTLIETSQLVTSIKGKVGK